MSIRFWIYICSLFIALVGLGVQGCTNIADTTENQAFDGVSHGKQTVPEVVSFNYDVKPILSDRCYACHGPDEAKIEAGLSLSTPEAAYAALGKGKDHFAIVPNHPEQSTVIDRIYTDDESILMPPPESNLVLSNYEKQVLKKWISQGAAYENHWSFDPIQNPKLPELEGQVASSSHAIDQFVQARLAATGLAPSAPAEKALLIRRLSFDLTGLSPTLSDIEAFVKDSSDTAYEHLVDKYLNSDAYAENLAAVWLDVARYADTHGYQDDLERTMWPWRDWVLHAFKNNLPYDKFVKLQLAGDLLPNASKAQIIATGFNRNHKITQEGGVIPEEYRVEYVSDRTLTFGKAFLGLSIECAKCHDHKYDPISQKDYYSLFAFFNNVPEVGLIEEYGITPAPFIEITKEEIEEQLTFINNLDTVERIELMVMEEMKEPRKTHVLDRGAYDRPTEEVTAAAPAAVLSFDQFPANRTGLADWLFDQRNPLTSRVMVNRLWKLCFGKGLVRTLDDFGAQGALPSHPQLLDHLAYKFMDEGWDIKAMLKYIVMSSTYQQRSNVDEKQLLLDPENTFYARGSRSRLSAEKIRDHVLASSGLLTQKVGGPSVKPYQPEGLWQEVVGGGGGSTASYEIDRGDKQYRRSLYTFWKRTVPPPDMMMFDAVTRDFCMVDRETTSTPMQALVMMNSPQVLEGARNLAYRAIAEGASLQERIELMFRHATSRTPKDQQVEKLSQYFMEEKSRFEQELTEAEALLAIGDSPQLDLLPTPELAAYALVATAIYNMDESITRS